LRKLAQQIISFVKEDFGPRAYLFTGLLMALALYINYFSGIKGNFFSVEEKYSSLLRHRNLMYLWYLPFYGLPYLAVLWAKLTENQHITLLYSKTFWAKFTIILSLLCVDGGFYYNENLVRHLPFNEGYLISKLINEGYSFITTFMLIGICYFSIDRPHVPFYYGINTAKVNLKPYVFILLLMVPVVYWASTTAGFLDQYPSIGGALISQTFGFSKTSIIAALEIIYLSDFFNLELLVRGLMVIGMTKILGRHAILPTTMVYVLLHFEKPIAEAIGSALGGYILGVLALRSQSIIGGCIVHVGVAALMEIFAYGQLQFN
jgi:hypothetical protein